MKVIHPLKWAGIKLTTMFFKSSDYFEGFIGSAATVPPVWHKVVHTCKPNKGYTVYTKVIWFIHGNQGINRWAVKKDVRQQRSKPWEREKKDKEVSSIIITEPVSPANCGNWRIRVLLNQPLYLLLMSGTEGCFSWRVLRLKWIWKFKYARKQHSTS